MSEIETRIGEGEFVITANKPGLILVKQLLTLAKDEVPIGYHLYFDGYNSLEEKLFELVIQKKRSF